MVQPVGELIFKINKDGRTAPGTYVTIADMETFDMVFDNNTEEWYPIGSEGWVSRLITAKSLKVNLKGKRNFGDAGNDYVAGKAYSNGNNAKSILQIEFTDGDTLDIPCIVDVTACAGGDSKSVSVLEFTAASDGKPTYVSAEDNLAALTFVCSEGTSSGTQIEAVSPVLGGGNSYYKKINGVLPDYGTTSTALLAAGWSVYTLGTDIVTTEGNVIAIVETSVAAGAIKGGTAPVVTA